MTVSRRSLRKGLVVVGCLFSQVMIGPAMIGFGAIALGALLHWLSKAYLEQNRDLTTAGPYRWTRNPFYLANLLIDLGIVFVIGRIWVGVGFVLLWGLAYRKTILEEEAKLRELFGECFQAYAERVPRLFPFRRPLEAAKARGRFDLANPSLAQGREYARLLGIALAPAAICAADVVRRLGLDLFAEAHRFELGAIALVPAFWLVKLGLAEAFRRPETRLLPRRGSGLRRLGDVGFALPILVLVPGDGQGMIRIATFCLFMGGLVAIERASTPGPRAWIAALLASGVLALGAFWNALWLAIASAAWFFLAALDEVGDARLAKRSSSPSTALASEWSYRPRIVAGIVSATLMTAMAIRWSASTGG